MVKLDQLSSAARSTIRTLLADPLFELVPLPKVMDEVGALPAGARVSVTASPNKSLEVSLDLAADLADRGFRVTPHISARAILDIGHLERLLARMGAIGLETAFVVGGDGGAIGEFSDGLSLLEAMDKVGHDLEVGIPAYPEGHPDITDAALVQALVDKQPYASWMTTQMCFEAAALETWLGSTRRNGITLPAVLGLPGVADRLKLLRISTRIGVGGSLSFLKKNTGLMSTFVRPGGYDPAELLVALGDYLADETAGITGLHIYTFNSCRATAEWRAAMLAGL